jgi:hypothetical protein
MRANNIPVGADHFELDGSPGAISDPKMPGDRGKKASPASERRSTASHPGIPVYSIAGLQLAPMVLLSELIEIAPLSPFESLLWNNGGQGRS